MTVELQVSHLSPASSSHLKRNMITLREIEDPHWKQAVESGEQLLYHNRITDIIFIVVSQGPPSLILITTTSCQFPFLSQSICFLKVRKF